MADKKKAYQRFVELTRQATAPMASEAERDPGSINLGRRSRDSAIGSAPAEGPLIRLTPELRRALEQRAATDNTTPSEIVHEALRRYLEIAR
jgi:hypothetical protein